MQPEYAEQGHCWLGFVGEHWHKRQLGRAAHSVSHLPLRETMSWSLITSQLHHVHHQTHAHDIAAQHYGLYLFIVQICSFAKLLCACAAGMAAGMDHLSGILFM